MNQPQGIHEVISDAGHDRTWLTEADTEYTEPTLWQRAAAHFERAPAPKGISKYGERAPGTGYSRLRAPLSVYRATSAQFCGLYPYVANEGLPPIGAYIGADYTSGGAFYCSPTDWVMRELVTNPNMIFMGEPGTGKSAYVKALSWRLAAFGIKTIVPLDLKEEYEPLARALGCEPLRFGPGTNTRINPLDSGPIADNIREGVSADDLARSVGAERVILLIALLEATGYKVSKIDEQALAIAIEEVTIARLNTGGDLQPTVPDVWHALRTPSSELRQDMNFHNKTEANVALRELCAALSSLVTGPLRGLFDEQTNVSIDFQQPFVSVSGPGLESRGEKAVGVALTCMGAWMQAATRKRKPGEVTIVINDEDWRAMRLGTAMVKERDARLRLSRTEGKIQIMAVHKPSDLLSVGGAGEQATNIAKDFIGLCSTKVMLAQTDGVSASLADAIGLTGREQDELTGWCHGARGRALWKVGQRGFKVRSWLTPLEQKLFHTDEGVNRKVAVTS